MKRIAPAAERNKAPILEVLQKVLPRSGLVLEVASGSGQHAIYWAQAFPNLSIQPSDTDPEALHSIEAYRVDAALSNLLPAIQLDATSDTWPISSADAVLCINMIHIAPWTACLGLLKGASRILASGAPLVLYGPFAIDGDYTAPSNLAFDARLRSENPAWGVRELRDIESAARDAGFVLEQIVPRPANNHVVVFRKTAGT